jgi:hypothetical protein
MDSKLESKRTKLLVVSCGGNGNAIAVGWSALVGVMMSLVNVDSCLMLTGKDWLILACGKKTRITRQTEET